MMENVREKIANFENNYFQMTKDIYNSPKDDDLVENDNIIPGTKTYYFKFTYDGIEDNNIFVPIKVTVLEPTVSQKVVNDINKLKDLSLETLSHVKIVFELTANELSSNTNKILDLIKTKNIPNFDPELFRLAPLSLFNSPDASDLADKFDRIVITKTYYFLFIYDGISNSGKFVPIKVTVIPNPHQEVIEKIKDLETEIIFQNSMTVAELLNKLFDIRTSLVKNLIKAKNIPDFDPELFRAAPLTLYNSPDFDNPIEGTTVIKVNETKTYYFKFGYGDIWSDENFCSIKVRIITVSQKVVNDINKLKDLSLETLSHVKIVFELTANELSSNTNEILDLIKSKNIPNFDPELFRLAPLSLFNSPDASDLADKFDRIVITKTYYFSFIYDGISNSGKFVPIKVTVIPNPHQEVIEKIKDLETEIIFQNSMTVAELLNKLFDICTSLVKNLIKAKNIPDFDPELFRAAPLTLYNSPDFDNPIEGTTVIKVNETKTYYFKFRYGDIWSDENFCSIKVRIITVSQKVVNDIDKLKDLSLETLSHVKIVFELTANELSSNTNEILDLIKAKNIPNFDPELFRLAPLSLFNSPDASDLADKFDRIVITKTYYFSFIYDGISNSGKFVPIKVTVIPNSHQEVIEKIKDLETEIIFENSMTVAELLNKLFDIRTSLVKNLIKAKNIPDFDPELFRAAPLTLYNSPDFDNPIEGTTVIKVNETKTYYFKFGYGDIWSDENFCSIKVRIITVSQKVVNDINKLKDLSLETLSHVKIVFELTANELSSNINEILDLIKAKNIPNFDPELFRLAPLSLFNSPDASDLADKFDRIVITKTYYFSFIYDGISNSGKFVPIKVTVIPNPHQEVIEKIKDLETEIIFQNSMTVAELLNKLFDIRTSLVKNLIKAKNIPDFDPELFRAAPLTLYNSPDFDNPIEGTTVIKVNETKTYYFKFGYGDIWSDEDFCSIKVIVISA